MIPETFPITVKCTVCKGDGVYERPAHSGGTDSLTCPNCSGTGQMESFSIVGLSLAFNDLSDKCQEIKTKLNQMQADINFIKAKVG